MPDPINPNDLPLSQNAGPALTPMPAPSQTTPAAQQINPAVPPAPPAQPEAAPGSFFKNLSHSFAGALLGTLAGKDKVTGYTTDQSGKTTPVIEKMSTGDQIREIAKAALTGLAAGAATPQQKSGLASGLAGLGAGMQAEIGTQQRQDLIQRQQATEQFQQQQKAMLDKATIAHGNALAFVNYANATKNLEDRDPEIQSHIALADAAQKAGLPVIYGTDKEMQQRLQDDPTFASTHVIRGIGMKPVLDENGKPLLDANGNQKMEGRLVAIPGTAEGNVELPANFVNLAKEYAPSGGAVNVDKLEAGQSIPMGQLVDLENAVQKGRDAIAKGWVKPEIGLKTVDGKQIPIQINTADPSKTKEFPNNIVPQSLIDAQQSDEVKKSLIKSNLATAALHDAQAKQALTDAKMLEQYTGGDDLLHTPPPNVMHISQEDLKKQLLDQKQWVPPNFEALYGVAHYKEDPSILTKRLYKGVPQMAEDKGETYIRKYINPNYDKAKWNALNKMKQEYYSTKPNTAGGSLMAFNIATAHLAQLNDAATALAQGDVIALNKVANELGLQTGLPAVPQFNMIRNALVGEMVKVFEQKSATDADVNHMTETLNSEMSPAQIQATIQSGAHLMLSKARALAANYYALSDGEYPDNLLTPDAKAAYDRLGITTEMGTAGTVPYGQKSTYKATATGPNGHKIGTNDDGVTWYDLRTNQPVTQQPTTQQPTGVK